MGTSNAKPIVYRKGTPYGPRLMQMTEVQTPTFHTLSKSQIILLCPSSPIRTLISMASISYTLERVSPSNLNVQSMTLVLPISLSWKSTTLAGS